LTTRVLISGAGIAGPTLAYWLLHYGFQPTIVEKARQLRTGGYVIDFWGAGFDIAERMKLLPELLEKGYAVKELRVVNHAGKRIAGFPVQAFVQATKGRFTSVSRADLAATIFGKIDGKVEAIFGDSVTRIEQNERTVRVAFEHGPEREFDLVIGADGLHSEIRRIVFGARSQFEKYLGYKVAAFEIEAYKPRDELVYVLFTEVHQQVGRFTLHGDRTLFLFTFADGNPETGDTVAQKALLRKRFAKSGWECPQILGALDGIPELYFDRVSQIRMEARPGLWSQGRVTLVGDAASCVSLLAGQGSALAMVGAYILAGELHRSAGDPTQAFARYQEIFGPFVQQKQKAALRFAGFFAPKSKASLFLRNQMMNLMRIPWVANFTIAGEIADKLELPKY
jgi:2-polyprenyl-6-methoxyphenol hydroxylase-like FAD-dependent oxidoreductase